MKRARNTITSVLVVGMVAAACGGSDDVAAPADTVAAEEDGTVEQSAEEAEEAAEEAAEQQSEDTAPVEEAPTVAGMSIDELNEFLEGASSAEVLDFFAELPEDEFAIVTEDFTEEELAELREAIEITRPITIDDIDCSAEALSTDELYTFTSAHLVVDGQLGDVCFGELDQRLVDSWNALSIIAPQGQLADLGLFGGFASNEAGDEITLAFVNALDVNGDFFQMSVNLEAYEADPNTAQATLAHEFAHVFTAQPSQMDRTVEAIEACSTYYNGSGCYLPDSIMYQYITEFWGDGLIDQIDPDGEATVAGGQERCAADAGFFGAYGASNPDEDFAEAFSVYVFDIETFSPEQQARVDWIAAQPGLAEFRERAVAANIAPIAPFFEECGLG